MASKVAKTEAKGVIFQYPRSEEIIINKESLQIQLGKFKKTILESFNIDFVINLLITLAAVWIPVFTADFKGIFGLSPALIEGGYIAFAILVSIYSLCRFAVMPIYVSISKHIDVSNDPEKMSQIILDKCSKK